MKICKKIGCENKHYARGWCKKHYMCWYKYKGPFSTKYEIHGYTNHLLYGVWSSMKDRCYNENNEYYKNYGGRGITICDKWKNSPKAFIEWALPLWEQGLEVDRIDNDGNYCPENCEFTTHQKNSNKTRLLRSTNTSGYRGVSRRNKKWRAYIVTDNRQKHLGYFDSPKQAALAFDKAVIDNRPRNLS